MLKRFLCPYFGVYVCTGMIPGVFGCEGVEASSCSRFASVVFA